MLSYKIITIRLQQNALNTQLGQSLPHLCTEEGERARARSVAPSVPGRNDFAGTKKGLNFDKKTHNDGTHQNYDAFGIFLRICTKTAISANLRIFGLPRGIRVSVRMQL